MLSHLIIMLILNGRHDRGELHPLPLPATRKLRNVFKLRSIGPHSVFFLLHSVGCSVWNYWNKPIWNHWDSFQEKLGYGNIYFKDAVNIKCCYMSHYALHYCFCKSVYHGSGCFKSVNVTIKWKEQLSWSWQQLHSIDHLISMSPQK